MHTFTTLTNLCQLLVSSIPSTTSTIVLINPPKFLSNSQEKHTPSNILVASLSVRLILAFLENKEKPFHTSVKHVVVDCALCNWKHFEQHFFKHLQLLCERSEVEADSGVKRLLKSFGIVDMVVVLEDGCESSNSDLFQRVPKNVDMMRCETVFNFFGGFH